MRDEHTTKHKPEIEAKKHTTTYENSSRCITQRIVYEPSGYCGSTSVSSVQTLQCRCRVGDDFAEFELKVEPTASYQRLLYSVPVRCH
jgi:hypothetical protein